MALVTAQKRQTLRLPTPDASVDSIDQLAFLGIWQVESTAPALSTNLKRQVLRLPIIDATVDENDAYAFLHLPQSGGGGNTTDAFSLSWVIDPTWTDSEVTQAGDGNFSVIIRGIGVGFIGTAGDRPAGGVEGYGGESMYNAEGQRRKRKKERLEELRAEIRNMNRWR